MSWSIRRGHWLLFALAATIGSGVLTGCALGRLGEPIPVECFYICVECGSALTIQTERGDELVLHPMFLGSVLNGYKPEKGCAILLSMGVQRSNEDCDRLRRRVEEVTRKCEKRGITVYGLGLASSDGPETRLVPTFEELQNKLRSVREGESWGRR